MDTIQKKKIRLIDVAKVANVSLPTASMALSNHPEINSETCKRVQMISKKLGYLRPGERTRLLEHKADGQKSLRFGFLLLGTRLNDEVMTSMLHEMSMEASVLKVRLELKAIEDISDRASVEGQVLEFVRELDGVIVEGLLDKALLEMVESSHVPCVVLGSIITQPGEVPPIAGHIVDWNVQAMGQLATGRLLACGHRRIGFFCERMVRGLWYHRWLMGYQNGHWEAGVATDPALVHVAGEARIGGKPAADYFTAMTNRPTAYVCPDIRVAASFVSHMADHGITVAPETILLGGLPEIAPKYHMESYPLIGQESERMGKVAVEYLHQLHQNPAMCPRVIQLPFVTRNLPEPKSAER